jgi:outer membrane immunogenic protein
MQASLLSALALIGLSSPTFAQTSSAPNPRQWTGFYVGGDLGRGVEAKNASPGAMVFTGRNDVGGLTGVAGPTTTWVSADTPASTLLGGLSLGYNYKLAPWLVTGVVTDLNYSELRNTGSGARAVPVGVNAIVAHTVNATVTQKTDWFGTLRGRVGVTPFTPNLLFYGTGGLAYGNTDNSIAVRDTYAIPAVITGTASESGWKIGWTAGAGAELAIAPNWSLKGEWLYVDFGKSTLYTVNNVELVGPRPFPIFTTTQQVHNDFHIARIGLNYRFGG